MADVGARAVRMDKVSAALKMMNRTPLPAVVREGIAALANEVVDLNERISALERVIEEMKNGKAGT